jgi:hypothetical protein
MVKWCRKFPRTRKRWVGALGLSWLVVPLVGAAGEEAGSPPESVTLDRLLTLPSALPLESSERGGLTRAEWSSRFAAAEAEVEVAQADLDESLAKLSDMAGKAGNWKVAAPGVQVDPDDNSPVNYGLKQEIRRKREDVVRAERKVRDLIVEANLAGVPENWYKTPESSK